MAQRPLHVVVRSYLSNDKPRLDRLLSSYSSLPSVEDAVARAALALDERGKRHPHQRRLKQEALEAAKAALLAVVSDISQASSFASLHGTVDAATRKINGLGELYVYDTALRIGARLSLQPGAVYLHAGTLKGAARLGIPSRGSTVPPGWFPTQLASLTAPDIENLLCIYKDDLHEQTGAPNNSLEPTRTAGENGN
ncbi:MAG: hypothetical protein ACRDG5_08505 [Anaerolineales bacterium]